MSRRCCKRDCAVMTDDFNRANSTIVGDKWNEHSGDWEIDTLQLAANSTGLVITKASITGTQRRYVRVKCINAQSGKNYRLCPRVSVDAETGAANCLVIEFDCGADGTGYLRLMTATCSTAGNISDGATIDEATVGYQAGNDYTLVACLSEEGIYGTIAEMSEMVWNCTSGTGGKAGIMNAGSAAEYDDFALHRHAIDILPTIDVNCPYCACECDGHCIPRQLTLTIESTCGHRDGLQYTLNFVESTESTGWYWEVTASMPGVCWPLTFSDVYFRLYCLGADGGQPGYVNRWALCTTGFQDDSTTSDWGTVDPATICPVEGSYESEMSDSHICDPLEIVFRAAYATCSAPSEIGACYDTIHITA